MDLYILQKLLTHKSPEMTQRYAHLRDTALKRASELASKIVEQATAKAGDEENAIRLAERWRTTSFVSTALVLANSEYGLDIITPYGISKSLVDVDEAIELQKAVKGKLP